MCPCLHFVKHILCLPPPQNDIQWSQNSSVIVGINNTTTRDDCVCVPCTHIRWLSHTVCLYASLVIAPFVLVATTTEFDLSLWTASHSFRVCKTNDDQAFPISIARPLDYFEVGSLRYARRKESKSNWEVPFVAVVRTSKRGEDVGACEGISKLLLLRMRVPLPPSQR